MLLYGSEAVEFKGTADYYDHDGYVCNFGWTDMVPQLMSASTPGAHYPPVRLKWTLFRLAVHHKISRNEAVGSVQNCTIPVHVSVETVDVQKGCDEILLQELTMLSRNKKQVSCYGSGGTALPYGGRPARLGWRFCYG
ncbi:hypothetical protein CTKA_01103 [Chthonomonas calidirosea]|uniref:Uncharacterized protein n=1 Tax=Chthonomonas calidirosea (strain DSM 23976 / ICMP 18418 / T49) TaxID=1303518 RepID=S0ES68_CHTCT|nr:hypothetical protein CCALI_00054 [Chthonomonas calidirosea T49]CEK16350.1 hypothetical protein CTKA_01103 [Chthonomonas calidirosea]